MKERSRGFTVSLRPSKAKLFRRKLSPNVVTNVQFGGLAQADVKLEEEITLQT